MAARHFLSIAELSREELSALLDAADDAKQGAPRWRSRIEGKHVALIFEKPSTRTRVSFEVAVTAMGGHALVLRGDELQLGRGETIEDTGKVLSRYVDALVVRTHEHERLERLSASASVPVINALSDFSHPCQCLADLQTIRAAKGGLDRVALAYVGDGNNVAHSLMFGGATMGMRVRVASPRGYEPDAVVTERARATAADSGGEVLVTNVVAEAAHGADVLYTDVWASMGHEAEVDDRAAAFERYALTSDVVALAADDAIVMHCL